MPVEPKFEVGDKVAGLDTRKDLKGKVVDTKETGFGLRYSEIKLKDGTKDWYRNSLLEKRD